MRSGRQAVVASVVVALALVGGAAFAEPHEGERHEHMDARHAHNHAYLDRGVVVHEVPRDARVVRFGHERYWYHGGVWYRAEGPGFVVIAPPVGAVVEVLPPFYTTVMVAGRPYYYANDTYYLYSDAAQGFQVVDPPPGVEAAAPMPPPGVPPGPPPGAGGAPPAGDATFVYPRNGQSPEQQASDKYECHRWAVDQTGFDPTRAGGGVAPGQQDLKRADYRRASAACLEARGYTVR